MEEESKVKRKRRLINSRQELLVLIATAILFYAGTCCFSIIAPFYAPEVITYFYIFFYELKNADLTTVNGKKPLVFKNLSFTRVPKNFSNCVWMMTMFGNKFPINLFHANVPFPSPWKHQKTKSFLTFSGCIEMGHWCGKG